VFGKFGDLSVVRRLFDPEILLRILGGELGLVGFRRGFKQLGDAGFGRDWISTNSDQRIKQLQFA
jgi:hypothetical protein